MERRSVSALGVRRAEEVPAGPDLAHRLETKGVVVVRLLQPTATGATVTMEPPPAPGTSYGVAEDSTPVLDGNSIDSSLLPFWVAFNLEPDDLGGSISITVDHPERECTVVHPVFPIGERYVTLVEVDCPPPP